MKKCKGFSLMELLIAMTILATAYLMLLGVFPVSMKAVKQGKEVLFSTQLAQRQMEKALYESFMDEANITGGTATLESTVNNVNTTTYFIYNVEKTFYKDCDYDTPVSASDATIKNILVTFYVYYQGVIKADSIVKLETYISREP